MNFQQYLDRYQIELRLVPRIAARAAELTCADIFEAWDCYTMLKSIDPIRDVGGLDGANYELGQVYLRRLNRTARSYLLGVDRRGHQSLSACVLIRLILNGKPLPTADAWESMDIKALDSGGRLDFVRDYESVSRMMIALLTMLEDMVGDMYLKQPGQDKDGRGPDKPEPHAT